MNLKEKIDKDLKDALKSGNETAISTLRMLSSAVHNKSIEKRTRLSKQGEKDLEEKSKLTEEEIISSIQGEAKKRKESIEAFEKGNRTELVKKEKGELSILEKYLPTQLTEEEIRKTAQEVIKSVGATSKADFGKVMKELSVKAKGRADGTTLSKIVQSLLN